MVTPRSIVCANIKAAVAKGLHLTGAAVALVAKLNESAAAGVAVGHQSRIARRGSVKELRRAAAPPSLNVPLLVNVPSAAVELSRN